MRKYMPTCSVLALVLASAAPAARAQITPMTLHGFCGASYSTSTCNDNGTITPTNSLSQFGFIRSPNSNNGLTGPTITLEFLIPIGASVSFGAFSSGTTTGAATSVTPGQVGTWTMGDLIAFLGYTQTGGPTNPIGAYLPSTTAVDPSDTTGYVVYQAAFGSVNFGTADPVFTDSTTLPVGTIILALVQWDGTGTAPSGNKTTCTAGSTCVQDATANSGALLFDTNAPTVPEPTSIVLLGTAFLGTAGIMRRRMRKKAL